MYLLSMSDPSSSNASIVCFTLYFTSTLPSRALKFPCPVGDCPLLLPFKYIQHLAPPKSS